MTLKQKYYKIVLTQILTEADVNDDYIQMKEYSKKYYYEDYNNIESLLEELEEEEICMY